MDSIDMARTTWNYVFEHRKEGTSTATLLGLIGDLLVAVEALQARVDQLESKTQ